MRLRDSAQHSTPSHRFCTPAMVSGLIGLLFAAAGTHAQVVTAPTVDGPALQAALGSKGLLITSTVIRNGMPGQFGTYSHFSRRPVTIADGVVMSSGDVTNIGPQPEMLDPAYAPSSPPSAVVNAMFEFPATGGTPEFDAYGDDQGNIHNFEASFDVAALEVHFTLAEPSAIQFDFIFASVEYPYWTNDFTDAFLVFLDGTAPANQIAYDNRGKPVQVGRSFAHLTLTTDKNTAFSNPHGLIHHLTTTSEVLTAGAHTIVFEIGDVNDQVLDSAVFIANFRTGVADQGTHESDDNRFGCQPADIAADDGTHLPTNLLIHSNTGVNEGDYNAFFQGFFDNEDWCDISDDAGIPLAPFGAGADNTGVNEGDYNCFFQFFFNGCP